MALLQKSRILGQERVDLTDYRRIEEFVCADFKAIHKYVWSRENYIISGFQASGIGTSDLEIQLAGSVTIVGQNDGMLFIGAPSLADLTTSALTPAATNYIELYITEDTGGADSRAFWDQTANANAGGEFSQIIDTFVFTKANLSINTSNFTGDPDKVKVCEVDVNGAGIITAIRDSRNLFWRLGTSNSPTFSYPWASRAEPPSTQFNGADKDIITFKDWMNAVMSRIRENSGTNYWYETPAVSLISSFRNSALATLTAISNTARFSWSGTHLSITDSSGSPLDSDSLAALRLFDSTVDLELTRQDGANAIALADGEVLWIEIPDPLNNVNYDGVGLLSTNFRISARGSVPLNDEVYWLAYREANKVFLRALGDLEPGEEKGINDEMTTALLTWLGFNPETATSVPYSTLPDSLIFGNIFTTSDHLVEAISTNAANINAIGTTINTNAYVEPLTVVLGVPVDDNEIQGPVSVGTIITLPLDSRDSNNQEEYIVNKGLLKLFLNGQLLYVGEDYNEVGAPDSLSDEIEILRELVVGDKLQFRIDSLGGFNVGSGGGGGGGDVIGGSNVGAGTGEIFKQKAAGILQFRKLLAGSGISITTVGDDVIISVIGGSPEPYFVNYVDGQVSTTVPVGNTYNIGTDKLDVYRNGVLMLKTNTLGNPVDRYQESTNTQISLALSAVASEVFSFVNQDTVPSYKNMYTGLTGTNLAVPAYTIGNDSIRVYRNGVLMNSSGVGAAVDQYSETSTTQITLAQAAVATDVFTIISGPIPSWREDQTGLTGTTVTLSTPYTMGTEELLIFKNGILMLNSNTLGNPSDRYQEASSTTIQLDVALIASDTIYAINK